VSDQRRNGDSGLDLAAMPEAWLEAIAQRTASILEDRWRKAATLRFAQRQRSEYLTVEEAAELLRSKRQRVYDLVSAGRLQRYKDGSRVLIKRVELDAYLAGDQPRRVAEALPPRAGARMERGPDE
jgi:excisionase family DNA binding protein